LEIRRVHIPLFDKASAAPFADVALKVTATIIPTRSSSPQELTIGEDSEPISVSAILAEIQPRVIDFEANATVRFRIHDEKLPDSLEFTAVRFETPAMRSLMRAALIKQLQAE